MAAHDLNTLRSFLRDTKNAVVFTGAGISTESGVPDFRSPGGVWSQIKPITYQDFTRDPAMRREAWSRIFSGVMGWTGAKPNTGHLAAARLVERGTVSMIITQNVDNLHQESGVPPHRIVELHGNATYAKCLDCGTRHELENLKQSFLGRGEIPTCRACGGLVKTATISFGQSMPKDEMRRAELATRACDLFVVLGSSLVVYPAAGFPLLAKRMGARLVIINRERTEQDDEADLVLHAGIGETLAAVVPLD